MKMYYIRYTVVIILFFMQCNIFFAQNVIRVGAKPMNENNILGEMIALILEDGGFQVERKFNLGATAISFEAIRNRAIDVYAEYSGTIAAEILKDPKLPFDSLNPHLHRRFDLAISMPYGFNNTYAIALRTATAQKYQLKNISDLKKATLLRGGLSYEFLKREDGWENLAKNYQLKNKVYGLEHALSYKALENNEIDFTDACSTDGEVVKYGLVVLEDDLHFFPSYQAVSFYQKKLPEKAKKLLNKLNNILTDSEMQRLNALVLYEKQTHQAVAQRFLTDKKIISDKSTVQTSILADILAHAWVHLQLTLFSLIAAMLIAIPLGMLLYRFNLLAKPLLYIIGIFQTIPSVALLALLIPFLGIGTKPALVALFLYALLPILRNTIIGLMTVDPQLKKTATALGLNNAQKLRFIELPLALPFILTGVRTAAVINVGTATLAAFIGAGGLGEFIVTGLALNNTDLILRGAIPSALLAIVIEFLFEYIERKLVLKHLQQKYF